MTRMSPEGAPLTAVRRWFRKCQAASDIAAGIVWAAWLTTRKEYR